jgi:predicted HicB family RNase H-like nuclease
MTCSQLGHAPNHSDSGQFRLRLEPELHARAALAAERQGKSLNARVAEVIARNVASP